MGIRVDKSALLKQLAITKTEQRKELYFHRRLLNDELPLTIGGGIGQSRICMQFLHKAHIGEVQASIWSEQTKQECKKHNIVLLCELETILHPIPRPAIRKQHES
jgi:aspartate--ammonia ligase